MGSRPDFHLLKNEGREQHMNKLANYLLIALLFTVFLPSSIALAVSGTAAITVNASIDNWTRILAVSGSISTGQGQQVTLKVINPSGQIDYLDQTASGAGGSYSFSYKLDESESGTYKVFVGGTAVNTPVKTSAVYTAPITKGKIIVDPRSMIINNGRAAVTIPMDDLNKATAGTITSLIIEIPQIESAIEISAILPADILNILNEKNVDLIVDTGLAKITVTPDALKDKVSDGAKSIEISAAKADKANLSAGEAQMVGDNAVYDFNIVVDGAQVSKFTSKEAVRISVKYALKPGEDPDKIVIYYLNDKGKLEAVRNCQYDAATGMASFNTNSF
jgi:hypothetical protein